MGLKTWVNGEILDADDLNNNFLKTIAFGGDGSDGPLAVSSGTTSIDLEGERVKIFNWTSIAITGTGAVNFINPHNDGTIIVFKSTGDVTLTSSAAPMLDASNCGALGGTGGTRSSTGGSTNGTDGSGSPAYHHSINTFGGGNTISQGAAVGTFTPLTNIDKFLQLISKYAKIFMGGGGGGGTGEWGTGGSGSVIGGNGGRGGGCLIIECAGYWNFTTANGIKVGGQDGGNGSITGNPTSYHAGGGGGGGGGFFLALYNFLTANTGTVNKSGGLGGQSKIGSNRNGNSASGGGSAVNGGGNGVQGTVDGTRYAGSGGDGYSFIGENTEF